MARLPDNFADRARRWERRASGYNVGKLMTPAPPISISKIIDLATGPKAAFYSLIAAFFLSPFVFVPDSLRQTLAGIDGTGGDIAKDLFAAGILKSVFLQVR